MEVEQRGGLEKVGPGPERLLVSPRDLPFLEKKQAWQLGLLASRLHAEGGGASETGTAQIPVSAKVAWSWEGKPGGPHLKGPDAGSKPGR